MTIWTIINPVATAVLVWIAMWVFKPWAGAYGGEKGKNLARKEDLDAIVAEMRAVTIAQKEIEHKLSGDLWHRQVVWDQKLEIYAALLKSVNLIIKHNTLALGLLKVVQFGETDQVKLNAHSQLQKHFDAIGEAHAEFLVPAALADVFANVQCLKAIAEYGLTRGQPDEYNSELAYNQQTHSLTLLYAIIDAAKQDLLAPPGLK